MNTEHDMCQAESFRTGSLKKDTHRCQFSVLETIDINMLKKSAEIPNQKHPKQKPLTGLKSYKLDAINIVKKYPSK